MNTIAVVGAVISALVGLGGAGSFVWAMSHFKGMQITLDLVRSGNDELRTEIQHERAQRLQERVECSREIANMEGRIQLLSDGLGERIAAAAIAAALHPDRRAAP